jgi:uncharacterized protein
MSGLYAIPVSGLKEGRQCFDFEINKEFFDLFEDSEVKEGTLVAVVEADKRSSHIDLSVKIDGTVRISCDRCLGVFSHPEIDPDIVTIPADDYEFDLKQYFYEYILLAMPIQRIHPVDSDGKSTCDSEMIRKLREHIISEEHGTDPRWDELKKIMNN